MDLIASRSNIFRVKSLKTLKESFRTYGLLSGKHGYEAIDLFVNKSQVNGKELVSSTGRRGDPDVIFLSQREQADGTALISIAVEGFMPGFDPDSVADRLNLHEDVPFEDIPQKYTDLTDLVADHLVEGEVAVFVGASIHKLAEINAYGVAVNHRRESKAVQLVDDIIDAAQTLATTSEPISAPYA